jgi:DNA-binding MarR family transcriptional regulator
MSKPARPNYQNLDENPGYQLWLVSNLWQRKIRRVLEPFGLTHVQFLILATALFLSDTSDCVTQAQVARTADIDEMMTSQVVRSLEERGFMKREAHPSDARARSILVTPKGMDLALRARATVRAASEEVFETLGDKQFELTKLMRNIVSQWRDRPY